MENFLFLQKQSSPIIGIVFGSASLCNLSWEINSINEKKYRYCNMCKSRLYLATAFPSKFLWFQSMMRQWNDVIKMLSHKYWNYFLSRNRVTNLPVPKAVQMLTLLKIPASNTQIWISFVIRNIYWGLLNHMVSIWIS